MSNVALKVLELLVKKKLYTTGYTPTFSFKKNKETSPMEIMERLVEFSQQPLTLLEIKRTIDISITDEDNWVRYDPLEIRINTRNAKYVISGDEMYASFPSVDKIYSPLSPDTFYLLGENAYVKIPYGEDAVIRPPKNKFTGKIYAILESLEDRIVVALPPYSYREASKRKVTDFKS